MEESKNPSLSQSELTQLETLIERLHQLFIASLDAKVFDLYIEPQIKDCETGVEYSAFARLTDFITDPNAASLLLAGDPGMGKTLLSLQIAQQGWYLFIRENLGGLLRTDNPYWQAVLDQSKAIEVKKDKDEERLFKAESCLPLWLWMPFLRSESNWRTELLETHFKQIRLLPKEIELLKKVCQLRICRLLPIMDGWDELPSGVVTENLYLKSGFWEEAGWSYVKVFSTCRPEAFIHYEKSQGDYRSIFHPKKTVGSYTILNLSPFELRHIKNYVERYLSTLPSDYAPITLEVSGTTLEQGNFDKAKQDWLEDYQKYTIDPAILKRPLLSTEKEKEEVKAVRPPAESQKISPSYSQSKPINFIDFKKETIAVPGDSHCAFYAIGMGLIENIYDGNLQLDATQHSIFLKIFGQRVLKLDRDASIDELKDWIQKNYITRYEFSTYQILKEPLRLLTSTLLQEKWKEGSLPRKLCDELVAMAKQAKDTKTNQLDVENFKAIFLASHLKEGEFGKALKTKLDEMTDPVGSQTWENNLFIWLSDSKTGDLYRSGVTENLWASREIELPLLGHYFWVSIYVDNKPIYQAKNHTEIGLVMQHGIHYDYQTKLSRFTAQRSAVLEMIEMGQRKANPILEKKLNYLDQAIAHIESANTIFLKQEKAAELDKEDEEKVDEEDLPEEESKSKQIPDILSNPPSPQPDTVDWRNLDTYLRYLEQIRGLSELVKTPFILSAVVQVLPTIVLHEQRSQNSAISRYVIYQYFVDHWLTKQAARLWFDPEKRANLPEFRAETNEASIAKLKACLLTYSENLARLALNLGKGKINVDLTEEDTSHASLVIPPPGKIPYFKEEPVSKNKIQLIRSGCLLKNIDNHFKFLHKSLVEYFAAKMLFSGAHVVADYHLNRFDENKTFENLDLNDHLLTTEPSIIYLLADKAKEDIHFKYLLYRMIELSKGEPSVANAAANAITILNAAGESFSGRNLRGVNIRGAILNGALCDHTNFEGADLRDVTAQHACFASANFSYAQTQGLDFREFPRIKHSSEITVLCVSPTGEWLLVGDTKGYVTQYSYPEGKLLRQWYRKIQKFGLDLLREKSSVLENPVLSLALHPDGRLAACGGLDGTAQLIYVQRRSLGARLVPAVLKQIEISAGVSLSMTFCHKSGHYLAYSFKAEENGFMYSAYRYYLQIWNVHQQRFLGQYMFVCPSQSSRYWSPITVLATCNQGSTLIAGNDKEVKVFFIAQYGGGNLVPIQALDYGGHFILSHDGCLLALIRKNAIQLYQTHDWMPLNVIPLQGTPEEIALAFSHTGSLLAVRSDTQLSLWDLSSGQHLYALPIPEERGAHLYALPIPEGWEAYFHKMSKLIRKNISDFISIADGLVVLITMRDTLYSWHLNRARESIAYPRYPISLSTPFLEKTEFSDLIHTDILSIEIDWKRGEFITKWILTIHNRITQERQHLSYQAPTFKHDSFQHKMVLSKNQTYLVTWNGQNSDMKKRRVSKGAIRFESLGEWFLTNYKIRVLDLKRGQLCWTAAHSLPWINIMFSVDDQWLVFGMEEVFIHNLEDGEQLLRLTTGNLITALALAVDKSWLAVADESGSLSVFNVKTQQCLYCLSNSDCASGFETKFGMR